METLTLRQLTHVRRIESAAVYASVLSGAAVDFGTPMPTQLRSVEQVNTAATSIPRLSRP